MLSCLDHSEADSLIIRTCYMLLYLIQFQPNADADTI